MATFTLQGTTPIFRGEAVFVTLPAGLVENFANQEASVLVTEMLADNNSLIPVPSPPVVDAASLNDPGTVIQATFSVPVEAGAGLGYCIASKSGRHDLTVESVSGSVASLSVSGIIFESETVEMFLSKDFVKEAEYSFVSNEAVNNFVVDVSSRTSAAPDLPGNSDGLVPEAL